MSEDGHPKPRNQRNPRVAALRSRIHRAPHLRALVFGEVDPQPWEHPTGEAFPRTGRTPLDDLRVFLRCRGVDPDGMSRREMEAKIRAMQEDVP